MAMELAMPQSRHFPRGLFMDLNTEAENILQNIGFMISRPEYETAWSRKQFPTLWISLTFFCPWGVNFDAQL